LLAKQEATRHAIMATKAFEHGIGDIATYTTKGREI